MATAQAWAFRIYQKVPKLQKKILTPVGTWTHDAQMSFLGWHSSALSHLGKVFRGRKLFYLSMAQNMTNFSVLQYIFNFRNLKLLLNKIVELPQFFFTTFYLTTKAGICHQNFMKNRIHTCILRPVLSEKWYFLLITFWPNHIFKITIS